MCMLQVPGTVKSSMDVVLDYADRYFFTPYIYPTSWPEENVFRQLLSLNIISDVGGALLYLITATFSYFFVFDKRHLQHPHILEVQYLHIIHLFYFHVVFVNGIYVVLTKIS